MPGPILPISGVPMPEAVRPGGVVSTGGFQDVFASAIHSVEAAEQNASASVDRFLSGEGEELHDTIMSVNRAELSFEMFLQVRNKVVGAYQEIMKMQL